MITASTSRKLPNVSWPMERENARGACEFGGNSAVMSSRPGSNAPQYTGIYGLWGNMLKPGPAGGVTCITRDPPAADSGKG
ncbi:hypothetical protein BraRD5C2_12040 [Bradyrhizobium sp. RD5-C2]|nr:hypothetical protein BraRD5C2_12040 [Bradyrhizobium sp. RD5-C2]